ncbi:MAG: hypothetical protein C4336_00575 [Armatimonadota bacterium]
MKGSETNTEEVGRILKREVSITERVEVGAGWELAKEVSRIGVAVLFHQRKTATAATPPAICHHLAERHPKRIVALVGALF